MDAHFEIFSKLNDSGNNLSTQILKAGAVLRLMKFRFMAGDKMTPADETDIAALLDVCVESMPHHNEGEIDAIDNLNLKYSQALKQQVSRADNLKSIVAAMQTIARLDSTCEELSNAAEIVFDLSQKDRSFEPDWLSLKEALELRGLTVEVVRMGNLCMGPSVRTKAGNKAQKSADRALAKLIQATNQQIALSQQIPSAAQA